MFTNAKMKNKLIKYTGITREQLNQLGDNYIHTIYTQSERNLAAIINDTQVAYEIKEFVEFTTSAHQVSSNSITTITSPRALAKLLLPKISFSTQEHFYIIMLSVRNDLIEYKELFRGTRVSTDIDVKIIFEELLKHCCQKFIIAHNHPSNNRIEASYDDIEVTKRILEASRIMGYHLVDHIILTKSDFMSMKEFALVDFD